MNCPRCGTKNQPNSISCSNCGFKLKIVCPRCKAQNPLGTVICIKCNLRLVRFCPKCRCANKPQAINCRKCDAELLKECDVCGTLNATNNDICTKCETNLNPVDPIKTTPKIKKETATQIENTEKLDNYTLICVELINIKTLSTKIENKTTLKKVLTKFYQTVAKHAKLNAELARKISAREMVIEFKHANQTLILPKKL